MTPPPPRRATADGDPLLTIGQVAERVGVSVSAIRFYEDKGLVCAERTAAGHRMFRRSVIRRLSLVLIAQRLGYRLRDIRARLDTLPVDAAPTAADWAALAAQFGAELDERIATLTRLRERLDGCIGCGCLSLDSCALYNADDGAAVLGPGPRWLLADPPDAL